jgi:hypothetical protein
MTRLNGVHALLAFLAQQAQLARQPDIGRIDVKQVEALLHEAQALNERLSKIEAQLFYAKTGRDSGLSSDIDRIRDFEGNWPAASLVRDVINSQERQHAFGHWRSEQSRDVDGEAFSYKEVFDEKLLPSETPQQRVTHRYTMSEREQTDSSISVNFGRYHGMSEHSAEQEDVRYDEKSRLLLISIGFAVLLFFAFSLSA